MGQHRYRLSHSALMKQLLHWLGLSALCAAQQLLSGGVWAQGLQSTGANSRQALTDAWWTGPMLATSADTLPRGHMLVEPYVYVIHGTDSNSFGLTGYASY